MWRYEKLSNLCNKIAKIFLAPHQFFLVPHLFFRLGVASKVGVGGVAPEVVEKGAPPGVVAAVGVVVDGLLKLKSELYLV